MLVGEVLRSARGCALAALLLSTALAGCASNRTASLSGGDITGGVGSGQVTGSVGGLEATAPALVAGAKMSLAAAVQHAINNNPDIGIARAQAKDADAGIKVARVPMMPTVDYSAAYGPEQTYASDTEIKTNAVREEASIKASQLIWDFGKTGADIERAKALAQSAELRLIAKTDEIIMATTEAYLAVLELDLQIGISQQNIVAHEEMHRIVSLNEEAGNGTVADVQKALTRLEAARNQTIDLQAQRRSAVSTFELVVGIEPGKLQAPTPPAPNRQVTKADIENYIATSPLLLSLEQDKLSLQSQRQALMLDYLPRVTIDGTVRYQMNVGGNNPGRADGRVMITASGTLFDGMDRVSKIEQIDARIEETEYRYRRAVDNLKFDYDDSTRVLDTASSRLASIAGQIASGEEVVTLYTQQFEAGTRGIFELLDAQQELSASRSEHVTAQFDVLRAKYRLLQLTGSLYQAADQDA